MGGGRGGRLEVDGTRRGRDWSGRRPARRGRRRRQPSCRGVRRYRPERSLHPIFAADLRAPSCAGPSPTQRATQQGRCRRRLPRRGVCRYRPERLPPPNPRCGSPRPWLPRPHSRPALSATRTPPPPTASPWRVPSPPRALPSTRPSPRTSAPSATPAPPPSSAPPSPRPCSGGGKSWGRRPLGAAQGTELRPVRAAGADGGGGRRGGGGGEAAAPLPLQALVLVPTRELALKVTAEIGRACRGVVGFGTIVGGFRRQLRW